MLSRTRIFVLLSLMGLHLSAMAVSANFTNIQQLLNTGKAEVAYQRLLSLQSKYEGGLEYDLLMAQAALLTERANVALFVLERVLILRPRHYQARLLMANAYARLGRPELARAELSIIIAAKSIRPQLKQQAESMLEQLAAAQNKSRLLAYVALGFGYDGNANSSTASQTFLGFNLSPESRATPSTSETLNLGMSWQHQLESKSIFFTTLDWRSNLFPQARYINNELVSYQIGWQMPRRYVMTYKGSNVNVNGIYNNTGNHLSGVWYVGKQRQSNIFLRIGEQHYHDSQSIKDVTQYQLGGKTSLSNWMKNTNLVTILAQDVATSPVSPYGRDLFGLNISKKFKVMNPFTVRIGAGVLYSQYRGLFFGLERQERQSSLNVGFHTMRWKYWELGLDLTYTDTLSSIALYDYERFTLSLNFKRNYVR